jgi:heparan-alpha-glucosaminide N-acetyltransferase
MLIPCKKGDQILNSCVVVASIELVQVKCGVRGDVGPACNVVGYLDRNLLGINHLYQHPVYQRTPVRYLCLPNSLFSINCPA